MITFCYLVLTGRAARHWDLFQQVSCCWRQLVLTQPAALVHRESFANLLQQVRLVLTACRLNLSQLGMQLDRSVYEQQECMPWVNG